MIMPFRCFPHYNYLFIANTSESSKLIKLFLNGIYKYFSLRSCQNKDARFICKTTKLTLNVIAMVMGLSKPERIVCDCKVRGLWWGNYGIELIIEKC